MNVTLTRRMPTVIAFAASGMLAATIAFAAWSSTGSGSGTAQSTTSANSVVSAVAHPADLFPGAVKTIDISITNPNPYPVKVISIPAAASELVGTCAAGSVTTDARSEANGLALVGGGTTIAPNSSGTYRLTSRMINDAADACKAQTFNLPLTGVALVSAAG